MKSTCIPVCDEHNDEPMVPGEQILVQWVGDPNTVRGFQCGRVDCWRQWEETTGYYYAQKRVSDESKTCPEHYLKLLFCKTENGQVQLCCPKCVGLWD